MFNRVSKSLMMLVGLLFCLQVLAQDNASNAKALVGKAVAFLKANGKDKALVEFNNPKGGFVNGELYVFVLDKDGTTLANGVNAQIVGKNVLDMKDMDGKYFIKDLIAIGNSKGSGWIDYKWPDPVTKKMRPKSTYVEKAGEVYLCVGFYK